MNIVKGLRTLVMGTLLLGAGHVQALLLTPTTPGVEHIMVTSALSGSDVAAIFGTSSTLELFYKSDYDNGNESGSFASSYSTSYSGQPNNALLSYLGGASIICPECYLVVKNGRFGGQYLFDIGSWNGTDTIQMEGFFADPIRGSISHIAIFGKSVTQVPESGALVLIGLGLLGLGFARRRKTH